jgi:hypothetical protein
MTMKKKIIVNGVRVRRIKWKTMKWRKS